MNGFCFPNYIGMFVSMRLQVSSKKYYRGLSFVGFTSSSPLTNLCGVTQVWCLMMSRPSSLEGYTFE